jgi:hypothetical protein
MNHSNSKALGHRHHSSPSHLHAKHGAWRKGTPHAVAYVLNIFLLIFLSNAEHASSTPENSQKEEYLEVFSPNFMYQRMLGTPEPHAQYISIIIVGKNMPRPVEDANQPQSKGLSQACVNRIYIAQLLKSVLRVRPKVVVLDVWFDPESCSDANSQPLWNELCSFATQIPVVSGLGSYTRSQVISDWPAEMADIARRGSTVRPTELVSRPAVQLNFCSGAKIAEGSTELDLDKRKVPLSWPTYDSFVAVGQPGQPHRKDSLSIAAIRAVDPESAILARVGAVDRYGSTTTSTDIFPYSTFIEEQDLPIVRAIDAICTNPASDDWQKLCSLSDWRPLDLSSLFAGKVVLIGLAGFGTDIHKSLIGEVPGVVLQGEYIESLLQNRIYKVIPAPFQILIWVIWLAILFIIPFLVSSPIKAGLCFLVAVTVPALVLRWIFVHGKYYTPLLLPLIVAGIFLFASRRLELALARREEKQ